ncbi:ATP-binding cassette domain-containing protein [Gracilibacillus alcaliphilus]|uniref:ATP-binding cassette domain-containing protein n=1 Tax=Gracilibacillus alcaliphilus TaxID=1401441 RepID=UPI00195AE69D|nr:ABC-type multidrug transport system fused ATPase/permease subunit [Gracilibacillus alcaliphilus]
MYDIAKKVSADDFIRKLTNGYQFSVGERGAKLSGGQRQRITLARSFIGNQSIVVFDEATSALDFNTEETILQQLMKQQPHQTIFMITHRLSTAMYCDQIILLEDGTVAAQATHEELLTTNNTYQDLYQRYQEAHQKTASLS